MGTKPEGVILCESSQGVSKEVKFTLILPKWCINPRANQQIEVLDIGEKDIWKIKHSNATEYSWGNMVFLIKYIYGFFR